MKMSNLYSIKIVCRGGGADAQEFDDTSKLRTKEWDFLSVLQQAVIHHN